MILQGSEIISTTAVTNSNGTTHYYEPVTDDNGNVSTIDGNQSIFVEIETQSNGKAVTKKDGTYVTNEHTTALPIENTTDNPSSTIKPVTEKSSDTTNDNADNNVDFEPDKPTEETKPSTSTTTENLQQSLHKKQPNLLPIKMDGLLSGIKEV